MKLFQRKKPDPISVPPELQQYYQVPSQPIVKKGLPVLLVLVVILIAAALVGGGIWLATRSTSNSTTKTTTGATTQKTTTQTPSSTVNTEPIAQPPVQ